MKSAFFAAAALVFLQACAQASEPQAVSIDGADGFVLTGTYWAGEANGEASAGAVLLLHQCNADRTMYDDLGQGLSDRGLHVLSVDARGFGDSTTDTVSAAVIRANATSRENYFENLNLIQAHWPSDVDAVLAMLRENSNAMTEDIVLVGASCGGGQALGLVDRNDDFAGLVLFSGLITEEGAETITSHTELPILFVGAEEDEAANVAATYPTAFASSPNPQSTLLFYKGSSHGHPLFNEDPGLQSLMENWIVGRFED